MRLLLARDDVNLDKLDNDGDTPLDVASRYGYEGVVRLLLSSGAINQGKILNAFLEEVFFSFCLLLSFGFLWKERVKGNRPPDIR